MSDRQPLLAMTLSQLDYDVLTQLILDLGNAGWEIEAYVVQPDFSEIMTCGLRIFHAPAAEE